MTVEVVKLVKLDHLLYIIQPCAILKNLSEAKEAWDRWIKEEGGSVVPWMQVFLVLLHFLFSDINDEGTYFAGI